jgi:Na+/proline symporter
LQYLPPVIGVFFIIGLIAAAYSSADSALTSLTTSFCIDFLNFEKSILSESEKVRRRVMVHVGFSALIFLFILGVNALSTDAVINNLFTFAGFTYGPIMGLFAFAILTKRNLKDKFVLVVCLIAPVLTYLIQSNAETLLGGFSFGSTILGLNALLTYLGLYLISYKSDGENH